MHVDAYATGLGRTLNTRDIDVAGLESNAPLKYLKKTPLTYFMCAPGNIFQEFFCLTSLIY